MPTPQSGSMAIDHQQAAAPTHFRVSNQASNTSTAQAHQPAPIARLQPAPLQTTLYQLRNRNQTANSPPRLSSMHAASLNSQQTADAERGAVAAADHTDEVLYLCSDAAARHQHATATLPGFDQSLSPGPSACNHPLHHHPLFDQQGSDLCTSDEHVPFGSPILQGPHPMPPRRASTRAASPPPGFKNVSHDHLFDEEGSDSTFDDSAQNLPPHMRVLRRTAALAAAPPPGFEDVIPQPRLSQHSEAAAGPSQTGTSAEPGSGHEGYACDRWPRPDGSHRHISEKGKRRQKRRALLRKQARQAQRS